MRKSGPRPPGGTSKYTENRASRRVPRVSEVVRFGVYSVGNRVISAKKGLFHPAGALSPRPDFRVFPAAERAVTWPPLSVASGAGWLLPIHPELVHLAVQIAPMEAERFGRLGHVAMSPTNVAFDVISLELVGRSRQG